MGYIINEKFNAVTPPAMPTGTNSNFVTAASIGTYGTQGVKIATGQTGASFDFPQNSGSADVQASVNVYVNAAFGLNDGGTASDYSTTIGIRLNGSIASGTLTGWQAQFRSLYVPSNQGIQDGANGFTILKFVAGTATNVLGGETRILPTGSHVLTPMTMTLAAVGNVISLYVRRISDGWYLNSSEAFQMAKVACVTYTDTAVEVPGSTTDKFGMSNGKSANATYDVIMDNFVARTLPLPTPVAGTTYVSTSGDDTTAVANDVAHPFLTVNAAIQATASGSSGTHSVIKVGAGRFNDPVEAYDLKQYMDIVGSGQNPALATGRGIATSGGTTLVGVFSAWQSDVTFRDFSTDMGIDVITTMYGGVAVDGFTPCSQPLQDPVTYPPRTNVKAYNITSIATVGTSVHGMLTEGATNCYFQNLTAIFGFAFVSKCANSVYRQVNQYGQGYLAFYAPVLKTNAYSPLHDSQYYDFVSRGFTGTGTGAQSQGPGQLNFNNIGDGLNTTGNPFPDLYNVTVDGLVVDGYSGAAVVYQDTGPVGDIHNTTAANVLAVNGTSLGTASGTGNSVAAVSATVSSVNLSFNTGTKVASGTCSPGGAPQYIRYSTSHGTIDSYSGQLDTTGVAASTVITITGTSYFGASAAVVTGTTTYTVPSSSTVTGVTVSPQAQSVTGSATQTYTAVVAGTGSPSQAVTWSKTSGVGSINSSTGVYTAPAATGSVQTAVIRATSTQDGAFYGESTVTIPVAVTVTGVTVSPQGVTLAGLATQTYTAVVAGTGSPSQAVTWSKTSGPGSINSSTGVYTAPSATGSQQVAVIRATSVLNGSFYGESTVTTDIAGAPTVSSVSVSPQGVTLNNGETQQYTAVVTGTNGPSQSVTWSIVGSPAGVSISGGGLVTVTTKGGYTVRATSVTDPTKYGESTILAPSLPMFTPGFIVVSSVTTTGATVTITDSVNGADPVTKQLYLCPTGTGFVPSPSFLVSGATSSPVTLTGLTPGRTYGLQEVYTDANGAQVYSRQVLFHTLDATPGAGSNAGYDPTYVNAAVSNAPLAVLSSNQNVKALIIGNPGGAVSYFQGYDQVAGVTVGTTAPTITVMIPAGQTIVVQPFGTIAISSGFTIAATTTPTGSTAPATALVVTVLS